MDLTSPVSHPAPHIQYPRVDSSSLPSDRRPPPMTNTEGEDTVPDQEPAWPGVGPRKWCKDYTWIDETSDRSPLLKDCLQIVKNHAAGKNHGGTGSSWPVNTESSRERAFTRSGCRLGGNVARGQ
ncbi:hypothetical protein B0H65DRAFT_582459 [Neurospora tetraspora]|uniref:Ecp2 effector protein-like domain-containing protein n=1 Tax=Neurospora tetraspora TaxID=94610 RepID=A0AAE0J901_9PEZI|nr:hypothetical protein B0H65DRAFT_582459 [Neurospora tetraspora]